MTTSRARVLLIASSVAILALSSCGKDETTLPTNAGDSSQECLTIGPAPTEPSATFHRAAWKTKLVDEHSDKILGVLAVTADFAVVAGVPYGQEACVAVGEVSKDVAIAPELRAVDVGGGSSQLTPASRVSVHLVVQGPARIKDDVVLNHPESTLAWNLNLRANGMDVAPVAQFTQREFRPAWSGAELGTRDDKITVEQVARP